MKIGCCIPGAPYVLADGTPSPAGTAELIVHGYRTARQAGYDYIECSAGMLLRLTEDELQCLAALAGQGDLHLESCNVFVPGDMPLVGPQRVDVRDHVREVCRRMQLVGAKVIVFGSGGARRVPDGVDAQTAQAHIEEFLRVAAEIAAAYDVTIAIEPLNQRECNVLTGLAEAAGYVQRLNLPNVRLLADAYHMEAEGETPAMLTGYADVLAHVHVAEPQARTYPGSREGAYLQEMGRMLRQLGYTGRVSIECRFDNFAAECAQALPFMRAHY